MLNLPQVSFPTEIFSGKKIWIFISGGILLFLLVVGLVIATFFRQVGPVTVTMWGMWEPETVYQVVVDDYKRQHPNVTIKYVKESPINFRDRLQAAMVRDGGPDLVAIHNTWLPMFKNALEPAPAEIYSAANFSSTFYPVAMRDLVSGGRVYGLPTEIDGVALYVNQDLFNTAGVSLPTTWEEFRAAGSKLTVRDQNGRIKTAGAAMGGAANIDGWQDIVSLMMLQAGVDLTKEPNSLAAKETLSYYTTFETVDKVWDETLDRSTLAFAKGTVAMYFGPSWRYFDIKQINPNLNFKIIPVPQLNGGQTVNFASYWAYGVSKKTANSKVAWDFLKFMTTEEELTKLYSAEAKLREFGQPYPISRMATLLTANTNVATFVLAGPTAQSWYLSANTSDGDTGINSRISKYYEDAINAMVRGGDSGSALDTVAKGVAQILGQYGIVSAK